MQKQPTRYCGFITYSREDEAKAKRLHRALERYRAPRGLAFEADGKNRKLGRFFCDSGEAGIGADLGEALKGALADSACLIVICSPQAAASSWVEQQIVQFRSDPAHGPVIAVIVKGTPNVSVSPNPRKAARECFPAALKDEIGLGAQLRKESLARTRARIASTVLDAPFDDLWRRDRGRAWVKGLSFTIAAVCIAGAVGFGALAGIGLALRSINAARTAEATTPSPNANAAAATLVACQASVESVRAWDAALQTGMRPREYRDMEKLGSVFKEAMYVCAATTGRRSTEQNARALCDRLNDVTTPEIPANATDAYADAMALMSEQLQAVKSSCDKQLGPGGANRKPS